MKKGIFVSYAHEDREVVDKIVEKLRIVSGQEVWYDRHLKGGDDYFSVIAEQILENENFVFIVSDRSVNSDFCMHELEFAMSEKRKIMAIWLSNISIPPRVKLIIQNTQYVNWYLESEASFLEEIKKAFSNIAQKKNAVSGGNDGNSGSDAGGNPEIPTSRGKYFVTPEERKKIGQLLEEEKAERYSICFEPENAVLLGLAYEQGLGIDKDTKRAEFYYKTAKNKGSYDGQYLYAALKIKDSEETTASCLSEMKDAAEHGSLYALTYFGDMYYYGKYGLTVDKEKAYGYWKQAAERKFPTALYYMAYGFRFGEEVAQDYETAYMYALSAKEYDFPRAYRIIGMMYRYGEYVPQDSKKAMEYFETAVKKGDYLSLCYIGYLFADEKKYTEAFSYYSKAAAYADKGEIESGVPYYDMGYCYNWGEGVETDKIQAVEYYFKAAERGNRKAKSNVAAAIKELPEQYVIPYMKRAMELHCQGAALELYKLTAGDGSSYDKLPDEAVGYLYKGAEDGDVLCMFNLMACYSFVLGDRKRNDKQEALKWFQMFLANADEKLLQSFQDSNFLEVLYYAYTIELDHQKDVKNIDRDLVKYYFKKTLSEGYNYFSRLVNFIVDGYLFPDNIKSGLPVDVPHAEEMFVIIEEHLMPYYEFLKSSTVKNKNGEWTRVLSDMQRGCQFISDCYKTGSHVEKDRKKRKYYAKKAEEIASLQAKYPKVGE